MDEKIRNRNHPEPSVIFGIETSFTADYLDTFARLGMAVAAGVQTSPPRWSLRGVPIVLHPEEISPLLLELQVILCRPGHAKAPQRGASACVVPRIYSIYFGCRSYRDCSRWHLCGAGAVHQR